MPDTILGTADKRWIRHSCAQETQGAIKSPDNAEPTGRLLLSPEKASCKGWWFPSTCKERPI